MKILKTQKVFVEYLKKKDKFIKDLNVIWTEYKKERRNNGVYTV